MEGPQRFQHLLNKYLDKSASQEEIEELRKWLRENPEHEVFDKIWKEIPADTPFFGEDESQQILHRILRKEEQIEEHPIEEPIPEPVIEHSGRRTYLLAAAILLLAFTGILYLMDNRKSSAPIVKNDQPVTRDIQAPMSNNAIITFNDGSTVVLDTAGDGSLAIQGNTKVIKLPNGEIRYERTAGINEVISFNTLTVPRGSRVVTLSLEDGSRIWMNSASSLRYPTAFRGKERRVEITGEAYFEIARNPAMPFIVSRNEIETRVYGTAFNVNAYEDETNTSITLIEGSVEVSAEGKSTLLKPGQQARVSPQHRIQLVEDADTEAAIAWKNGYFQFTGNNIETVMRQVSRWYDVEVVYEGQIPERKFAGQMDRSNSLSSILKILEESNVHFKTEGKKVTVMP